MNERYIDVDGETIAYFDEGDALEALIFIHGAFIDKSYWNDQLAHFKQKYRVLAIDLPGHGASSMNKITWSIPMFARLIRHFAEKLDLNNLTIIGHSLGADVMLEVTTFDISRISRLVDVDHLKQVGVSLPAEAIAQLVASLKENFAGTCEQYATSALMTENTRSEISQRLLADYNKMLPEFAIPLLASSFNYAARQSEILSALPLKLYLMHVNYDHSSVNEWTRNLGCSCELHKLTGTCHYPMIEQPKQFNETLDTILAGSE
ncbi:Dihydrolipoyllysine-residue acetyltransferase component of acetoin cleaving system [Thalassocella blandensis]|nr:Dihydrolipoyllysine-residue acetyltransferase component of acetoin cleaving system [Thalassocella blandensis]